MMRHVSSLLPLPLPCAGSLGPGVTIWLTTCEGMRKAEHSLGTSARGRLCSSSEEESSFQPTAIQSAQHVHGAYRMPGSAVVLANCLI